jgi:hypothetical protein
VLGERLAGFVYGTIVALSVLIAGTRAYRHEPGHIAALVLVTSVVFWLAHVYAHALGESVVRERRLTLAELRNVGRHEAAIIEAALVPVAALLLGALGVISTTASVWLALALGLAVLAVQGLVFARLERLSLTGTLVIVSVNLALGVALICLKLLVGH